LRTEDSCAWGSLDYIKLAMASLASRRLCEGDGNEVKQRCGGKS